MNQSRWILDSCKPKEPCVRCGPGSPGKGAIMGRCISRPIVKHWGEIRCQQKLFATWKQRCGLSLLVLQQLVSEMVPRIHNMTFSDDVIMNLLLSLRATCENWSAFGEFTIKNVVVMILLHALQATLQTA